jgi:hypothetical protein
LTFCALEIEYLGYVLTRDGIEPQSNKVQAILTIKPPTGVKQLRHLLGMVQYYRDLWARWSDMLAPLTSLVGECIDVFSLSILCLLPFALAVAGAIQSE